MEVVRRDPNCTMCKLHKTAEYVCLWGQGPKQCDIMVIGEAPGRREDDSGRPFVGASGKLLERLLKEIGLDREEVYITNAVHCRPPDNRTPSKAEVKACRFWLEQEIKLVQPKFVLTLGNIPLQSITGQTGIKRARGKPQEINFAGLDFILVPTFHPSFILRDPENEYYIKRDLAKFREIINFGGVPYEREIDYTIVDTWPKVEEMLDDLKGTVSCDTETTGLYPWDEGAQVVSLGFGTARKQWILPFTAEAWKCPWTLKDRVHIVDQITERLSDCILVGHNWKFDSLWMRVIYGVDWPGDFDTMLAHYAIDENKRHGLDELASFYFGAPEWDVELTLKQGKSGTLEKHALYLAQDLYYTRKLKIRLSQELNKDPEVKKVFNLIIMPCSRLFTEVEWRGVYINEGQFEDAETYLREQLAISEAELSKYGDINWASPKQVGDLFFNKLNIAVVEKTKKGGVSTSESVLKRIDHPAAGALIKYRASKQQLSFFIEGWKPYLVRGRLHPSFKLHGTVTGRLSCEHPNLQQVPRDPRIRSLISAPPGWSLIEMDLSQIELRITAELSRDPALMDAFLKGVDVHWLTAMTELKRGGGMAELVIKTATTAVQRKVRYNEAIDILLEIGPDAAIEIAPEWKELRKKAKAVNFGYVFGMWWKKFKIYARDNYDVHLTDKEAEESRTAFFELYKLDEWHRKQKRFARDYGYVQSLSGRKRRLPEAMSPQDTPQRAEAERQSINSPVQSFANDINLMIALQLREEYSRSVLYLVGTVHDAVLLEVRDDYVEEVYTRALEIARRPKLFDDFEINLKVPVEADAKIGAWSKGVSLKKWKEAKNAQPVRTKETVRTRVEQPPQRDRQLPAPVARRITSKFRRV